MNAEQPIGIFDSGVGGLTIWKELQQLLPSESFIYVADSINAPYGERTQKEIIELSRKNTRFLLAKDVKLIVVACNTATTLAIQHLRREFNVSFVGIEPAFKPAALKSKTKKVGVLATKGTLNSTLFNETYRRFGRNIQATIKVGRGLVELIESGKKDSPEMRQLLYRYLQPMIANDCDHIVLGCTHYPFLKDLIQEITPEHVEIIDSGAAVAQQTKRILMEKNLLNTQSGFKHTFFTNGSQSVLESLLTELKASHYTVEMYNE